MPSQAVTGVMTVGKGSLSDAQRSSALHSAGEPCRVTLGPIRLLKAALRLVFPLNWIIAPQETALHSTTTFCLCFKAAASVQITFWRGANRARPFACLPKSYELHGVVNRA